jgi:hypothetical protein
MRSQEQDWEDDAINYEGLVWLLFSLWVNAVLHFGTEWINSFFEKNPVNQLDGEFTGAHLQDGLIIAQYYSCSHGILFILDLDCHS